MNQIARATAIGHPNDGDRDFYARLIARHSTESIVVTGPDGRVLWCNEAFKRLSGYELDDMVAQVPGELLQGPQTDPETVAEVARALAERREIQTEIVNYTKAGAAYWIEMRITPVFDDDGTHTHFMAIERDITQRKEIEAQAARMLAQEKRMRTERQLLAQTSEWLYSARSVDEVLMVVERALGALFPGSSGALFTYANSRDVLDRMAVWGAPPAEATPEYFEPASCWSLRRGRAYHYGADVIAFPCAHVADPAAEYFCLPLIAHGETIGLLHVVPDTQDEDERAQQFQLALLCAEQMSLALANVQMRQELLDQSVRDPLTGLPNRRWYVDAAGRDFARAADKGTPVALISLDVDHFKRFNDNHGHDAGDTVLREIGAAMTDHFPEDTYPCRIGGEEFVVLCASRTCADAAVLAEGFRDVVRDLSIAHSGGRLPPVTVSAGIAAFPNDGNDLASVSKAADRALYRAKAAGRDRVELAGTGGPDVAVGPPEASA